MYITYSWIYSTHNGDDAPKNQKPILKTTAHNKIHIKLSSSEICVILGCYASYSYISFP